MTSNCWSVQLLSVVPVATGEFCVANTVPLGAVTRTWYVAHFHEMFVVPVISMSSVREVHTSTVAAEAAALGPRPKTMADTMEDIQLEQLASGEGMALPTDLDADLVGHVVAPVWRIKDPANVPPVPGQRSGSDRTAAMASAC